VLTLGHAQVPRPHFARPTPYTVNRGLEAVGQPTAAADHGREGGRGLKAVLVCVCVCVCACQAELDPEALVPLSQLVELENSQQLHHIFLCCYAEPRLRRNTHRPHIRTYGCHFWPTGIPCHHPAV